MIFILPRHARYMTSKIAALLLLGALAASAETILVHGHRGGRATRPENTLPAFE